MNSISECRLCNGCDSEIGNEQRYLQAMEFSWHPNCFRCQRCGEPISDFEFSVSKKQWYHKNCYKELYHPRCEVCNDFIKINAAGLVEYRAHPFWLQKYCPSHEHDGTAICCSCERMESFGAEYMVLDDDRKLCSECFDCAIMNTQACQPLYLEVREFFKGLNMEVHEQIPLLLVEAQQLNEAMKGDKSGHHYLSTTRGLCLSEEQSVNKVLRHPRFGNFRIIDTFIEPYRLMRRSVVTAILLLFGLPLLLTGSILVHEMMHAWLRLNGYFNLSADVEEGMCQVLAHMWLDLELKAAAASCGGDDDGDGDGDGGVASLSSLPLSSPSSIKVEEPESDQRKLLGEFFIQQIESHSFTAYGEGFKEGKKAVDKYGLKRTLDHIRLTGCFPP